MDHIFYLKHCTHMFPEILESGKIQSAKDLNTEGEGDNTKIYLEIDVINNIQEPTWGSFCILLNKKILLDRKDYFINLGWKYGKKELNSFDPNDFKTKREIKTKLNKFIIEKIKNRGNEVVFNQTINLDKSIVKGFIYNIDVDDKEDIRLDLIYHYSKHHNKNRFDLYKKAIEMIRNNFNLSKKNLKKIKEDYEYGINIIKKMNIYSNNIYFKYTTIVASIDELDETI